jgi:hypothetical protein
VAVPRKEHTLLSAFLDSNEGKLAEKLKRSVSNTTGHREGDVQKDRKVVNGDERSNISGIAGRKSPLVCNMAGNCKEEFEHLPDPAKFVLLFLTGAQKHLCVCVLGNAGRNQQ